MSLLDLLNADANCLRIASDAGDDAVVFKHVQRTVHGIQRKSWDPLADASMDPLGVGVFFCGRQRPQNLDALMRGLNPQTLTATGEGVCRYSGFSQENA